MPQSLFKNYEGACFCAKGQMTRRNEGSGQSDSISEDERMQIEVVMADLDEKMTAEQISEAKRLAEEIRVGQAIRFSTSLTFKQM
ncbi:MAG: hypothetical protein ACLQU4_13450 [Limisphaerales bacterium]